MIAPRSIVLALFITSLGCDPSDGLEPSGEVEGSLSDMLHCGKCDGNSGLVLEGAGTYEVPVAVTASAAMKSAAHTVVDDAEFRIEGGVVVLDYDLPLELTGVEAEVELTGLIPTTSLSINLEGPAGQARCALGLAAEDALSIECDEELPGVVVDSVAVRRVLEASGMSPAEVAAHIEVSDQFTDDPIGILRAVVTVEVDDD